MSSFLHSRTSLALAATAILLAGLAAGAWRYTVARDSLVAGLQIKVHRSAVAFEDRPLDRLPPPPAATSPLYQETRDRLDRLRVVDAGVMRLYLLGPAPGAGRVVVLAAANAPGAPRPPDAAVPDLTRRPGLQRLLQARPPAADAVDYLADRVSAYAPVGPRVDGAPAYLLGVDVPLATWRRTIWSVTLATASFVWVLLLLPLTAVVTTRRHLEQREALRNLTEAMEQSHSAMVIIDLRQQIEYANAGFCRQIGYKRRDLIGRPWREFYATDTVPEVAGDLAARLRAGVAWSGECVFRRVDGTAFPARGGVTPVKNRAGEIRSYVAVFEDVTEIHRTEALLREAKERAEAGDRAKGQFLATMSHEVRTPLNGIVGFASLLLDTPLRPEQQEYVETIRTSSETLIQLTGDILDYARIESGRLKLEPQPCDPRECVESALDLAAAAAEQKGLELLHWIDESVPAAIEADVSRLRQVLVNLVNNAVKFTSEGEVEVRVSAVPPIPAPPGECVLEFAVRDTGIGIAPEHHAKIFRPFSQADDSTTRRYGGTGLGLAICKNIVELMHGTISFVSTPGGGSTFCFTVRVPVHTPPPAPAAPALAGRRLAVAASAPSVRAELARLVTRLGATPLAIEPAALATTPGWDLAIVDVNGPHALELAALRAPRPELPAEKLIALVPIVLPGELRAALRSHFRLVLNKPLHHDMLASLLSAPAAAAPNSAAPFGSSPPAAPAAAAVPPARFDLDVLIVEDNAVNQRLIQKMIGNLGCRWTPAAHGRAALAELARKTPDVVLMDLHMPELDGLSAINKIRAGEAGAAVRDLWIIALTADARDEQRERTLAAGANDYITKPVRMGELTAALQRFEASRRR